VNGLLLDTNIPSELTYPRPAPQVEQWLEQVNDEQLQDWLDSTLRPWFAGRVLPVREAIAERLGRWAGEGEAKVPILNPWTSG
jgi:predicted nucleic acid-binding protein